MSTTSRARAGGRRTTAKTTKPARKKPAPKPPEPPKVKRDPEDDKPMPETWEVTFTTTRTVEVKASSAADAEEKARESVLFADEFPIDREEITDTNVGWKDPDPSGDPELAHLEGCWGRHCRHYGCDISELASTYDEYCSQCDINAY
jgi:hypothetical protein